MKQNFLLTLLAAFLLIGGMSLFALRTDDSQITSKIDERSGIKFEYRVGVDGYVLLETKPYSERDSLGGYQLLLQEEYDELQEAIARGDGREGPQSINIQIFDNRENVSASVWADQHKAYSNINLAIGEINRDAVLSGANAVRYVSDGLYVYDTWVVAHSGYIFIISGPKIGTHPVIGLDYQAFLNSVEFVEVK